MYDNYTTFLFLSFSLSAVSEALLQSRVKYEEMISQMRPGEQDFYKMVTTPLEAYSNHLCLSLS